MTAISRERKADRGGLGHRRPVEVLEDTSDHGFENCFTPGMTVAKASTSTVFDRAEDPPKRRELLRR